MLAPKEARGEIAMSTDQVAVTPDAAGSTREWEVDDFDPRWPEYLADPYPFYRRLREEQPVHFNKFLGIWLATSYGAAEQVLTRREFGKVPPEGSPFAAQPPPPPYERLGELPPTLLEMDPPDHTRIRGLVNKAFSRNSVGRLAPRIEEIVDTLLEPGRQNGYLDLLADFASPMPALVIGEMLGVPEGDLSTFRGWTQDLARSIDVTATPEIRERGLAARLSLADYFKGLVDERRVHPGEDLISDLIRAETDQQRLTEGEILSTCILLLFAGYETTVNLVAVGALNLVRHPEQLRKFRERPELTGKAIEELCRFEPPVQRIGYAVQADVELDGVELHPGDVILAVLAAANRDPSVFDHPDELDVERDPNPHLGFSKGLHFCLGTPLARVQGPIALTKLVNEFEIEPLNETPAWVPMSAHRKLHEFPANLTPRRR
jgi:pimeloyl-[acyl-carrier protein] synthase